MKIIYLSNSTIPSNSANSIHVMKMCQAFAENGHEVVLLAPDDKANYEPGVNKLYSYYGVKNCFRILKLSWLPIIGRHIFYAFIAALKAKLMAPDLVYCRSNPGFIFAIIFRLPTIYEVHAPFARKGLFFDRLFGSFCSADSLLKVVVITHSLRQYFETKYPLAYPKIIVAPDGADPLPTDVTQMVYPKSRKRLQVGYSGHLYNGKGMEIVSELAAHCPWADFHVVGGTKNDLSHWKNKCVNCSNITFHGHVPNKRVSDYILTFDVALLPNQRNVEAQGGGNIGQWTSPLKAFEYMAAAKPIICSDLPVLKEIFKHDINAILCPPDDLNHWISALINLRDNPTLRVKLGETAKRDFLEKYTWSIRAKKILDN